MKNQLDTRGNNRARSFFDFLTSFDDNFDRNWVEPSFSRLLTNVNETDSGYLLSIDMPGVSNDDIQINIDGNVLNLSAEHQAEENARDSQKQSLRQYRKYQQSFTLPVTVNAESIQANYENGVLELFLPKSPQSQPKKIEVQSGRMNLSGQLSENKNEKSPQNPSQSQSQKSSAKH